MHAWSISYCDSETTNGFIPAAALPTMKGVKGGVKALVDANRWIPVEGGWELHDFLKHNRSRENVEAIRAANRTRKVRERANGDVTA